MNDFEIEVGSRIKDFVRTIDDRRNKSDIVRQPPRVTFQAQARLDSGDLLNRRGSGLPSSDPLPKTAGNVGHYSFQIVDASAAAGYAAVLVYDGLVNDELPAGMGGDNYILAAYDGMEIFVGITYDTDTFEITSRYLDVGTPPDDEFGFFAVLIGGTAVTTDASENTTVSPFNSHCGDIFFTIDFGGRNGKPAIKATPYTDWMELPIES